MRIDRILAVIGIAAIASLIGGGMADAAALPIQRDYIYGTSPQYLTAPQIIEALQEASQRDRREARDGNKNNPIFVRKSIEATDLAARLASRRRTAVAQVDEALEPVHVW
jgi:hypothetical protein